MDDQLDNDLKKRIREVFDNYNDEHADEGWLLLREKFPERARRRPLVWLWWSSAAAVLLLFAGLLLFNGAPRKENKLVVNKPAKSRRELKSAAQQSNFNISENKNKTIQESAGSARGGQSHAFAGKQTSTGQSRENAAFAAHQQLRKNKYLSKLSTGGSLGQTSANANEIAGDKKAEQLTLAPEQANTPNKQTAATASADQNAKTDSAGAVAAVKSAPSPTQQQGINMPEAPKKDNTVFADNQAPKKKSIKSAEYVDRTIRFGVYATSFVDYAKGSYSQLNAGMGISSDIKLTRKLNLSTGVAIAQNSLNFGSQIPAEQAKLLAPSAASSSATSNTLVAAAYSQNSFFAATPALKNYNASLVGLDVPVNLKYQFNPEKNAAFISIGVSSGTFINERYTSIYNYVTPFASNLSQTTDQSLHQSFSSFYFAKTLNFSFGTGYRIAGNYVILEPFFKYPLQGLGSQQIKFGSGGVNLKFSFPSKRN